MSDIIFNDIWWGFEVSFFRAPAPSRKQKSMATCHHNMTQIPWNVAWHGEELQLFQLLFFFMVSVSRFESFQRKPEAVRISTDSHALSSISGFASCFQRWMAFWMPSYGQPTHCISRRWVGHWCEQAVSVGAPGSSHSSCSCAQDGWLCRYLSLDIPSRTHFLTSEGMIWMNNWHIQ